MLSRLGNVPFAYLLLWCGSFALSIALVVLLRSRWGRSRTLHQCAVLSLLVHLLLVWAAMTLRVMAGDWGGGIGPPIHVRILHDAVETGPLANMSGPAAPAPPPVPESAPPLLEPPADSNEASAHAPTPTAEKNGEPSRSELVAPEPVETAADNSVAADVAPPDNSGPVAATDSPPTSSEPIANSGASPATPPTAEQHAAGVEPATQTAAASTYSQRTAPDRTGIVENQGGSAETEAAVAAALRWLAAAQSTDGRWDANRFDAGQEQMIDGQNRGGAGRNADTGVSALALLAFLGAGHSHQQGEYRDTVHRGLDFLLRSQAADGNFFGNATPFAQMYCHSMATFALAEAQAMSGDARLRPAVAKAAAFCLAAQNQATGGWRYRACDFDPGDTSQLGWQMMALASSERAGVTVPPHAWQRIERFLRSVRRGNHGGLASYRPDSGPTTSMTAEAFYCRVLLTDITGASSDEAAASEATAHLLAALPDTERINLYYWYYGTLSLHHRMQRDKQATAAWSTWNDALASTLVHTQVTSGTDAGSWNTDTVWGGYGGRVYTTAMATMSLEAYYRYVPLSPHEPERTATRADTSRARR